MGAIILWLCGVALSFLFLYLAVRGAINDSNLSALAEEFRTTQHQMQRQHEELMRQLEELKLAVREKDTTESSPPQ